MLQATPKSIHIYLESNPNPNSLKFVVNEMLVPDGMSFDFPSPAEAEAAPLAQELFMYPFVERVFYMSNFVTVADERFCLPLPEELSDQEAAPLLCGGLIGYRARPSALEVVAYIVYVAGASLVFFPRLLRRGRRGDGVVERPQTSRV